MGTGTGLWGAGCLNEVQSTQRAAGGRERPETRGSARRPARRAGAAPPAGRAARPRATYRVEVRFRATRELYTILVLSRAAGNFYPILQQLSTETFVRRPLIGLFISAFCVQYIIDS